MIKAYVGDFGSGKTANMVWDLMQAMIRGAHVITNTPIKFYHDPLIGKGRWYEAEFISNGKKFQEAIAYRQNCIFAIDEAAVYLPNIYWSKLPPEFIVKFAQNRKYRTDFYYTTQGFGHAVKRLRELTHICILCNRSRLLPLPAIKFKIKNRKIYIGPPVLFKARFFDPAMFYGTWTIKKYERYLRKTRYLYPSQIKRIFRSYNTMYVVDASAMMNVKGFVQPSKIDEEGKEINRIQNDIVNTDMKGLEELPILSDSLLPFKIQSSRDFGKQSEYLGDRKPRPKQPLLRPL